MPPVSDRAYNVFAVGCSIVLLGLLVWLVLGG